MQKPFKLVFYIVFITALLTTFVIFVFIKTSFNQKCGSNFIASGGTKIGGQFELTNVHHKKISSKNFITSPALIYFGYSYCPDICPYDLQRNVTVVDILKEKQITILPIFVTIDPERDTPERLKDFSSFVHPNLLALTGSQSEIKEVMKLFKVYGQMSKSESVDKNNYLMDHSAFTYLVDSSGNFLDYFNRQVGADEMADKITCFIES